MGIRTAVAPIVLLATLAFGGCTTDPLAPPPQVPDNLKVGDKLTLAHEAPASGVQIYDCAASKADPAKYEWVFRAPEADLFDKSGTKIGTHYAGPTWESRDGSKVVGAVKASNPGPDANAIPWLLLEAKTASGSGAFGRTQAIQRVNTSGGKAPAGGCDASQSGKVARVPYKATYYFYVPAQ
jgi:hypothetical protein